MHKSQSTITYAVQKIQQLLDVKVFETRGRKAVLTEAGQVLYRRARTLLEEAQMLERGAAAMADDWQPEIRIAVELIFPTSLALECLAEFARSAPRRASRSTRPCSPARPKCSPRATSTSASGRMRPACSGELLMAMNGIAVAHPNHPLHQLGRNVTERDLRAPAGSSSATAACSEREKWKAWSCAGPSTKKATSIRAVTMGLGYAYLPEDTIREELRVGT